ncbi:hypothetical protein RchiOBHm_Chr4g0391881 [Rosa chinensis]|uniref:Uncharacterized protein n=1 Tax=Rosa chinensis TaxID=74649 RepID=A0A2P6QQL4_ROSCH|nr:hypothetical protein RchiOBHm_Chr4g0391881 [Rosa chinensis]
MKLYHLPKLSLVFSKFTSNILTSFALVLVSSLFSHRVPTQISSLFSYWV